MKKVRYAFGAIGAAPALGLIMTQGPATTAHTAEAKHPATAKAAKTVSLPGSGINVVTGCKGVSQTTRTAQYESLTFWHTPFLQSECIGTVRGMYDHPYPRSSPSGYRVRIYHNGVRQFSSTHYLGRSSPPFLYISVGVHRWFKDPVQVCGAWVLSGRNFLTPICTSVG